MGLTGKKRVWVKWLVIWVCVTGSVGGGYAYVARQRTLTENTKIDARKVKVTRLNIRKELNLAGKVLPSSSVAVYSPVSGQLQKIFVGEGDKIKQGQNLFSVVQDTTGQKELESLENEVQRTRLELKAAEENLERRKSVKDLFSNTENERAQTEYDRKKLEADAARRRFSLLAETLGLEESRKSGAAKPNGGRLSLIYVRAPKDGVVTFINKFVGESVFGTTANAEATGREVLTLSDTERMIVRSRILEADLATVKVGMPVDVRLDAFRDKTYSGALVRISQQGVEDKSGGYTYFVTDVSIAKPDADVRAQMNATLTLRVAERLGVLGLPANAVASLGGHSIVELPPVRSGKARYKPIKTGLLTDQYVEITENSLSENDEVLEIDFSKLDLKALAQGKLGQEAVN